MAAMMILMLLALVAFGPGHHMGSHEGAGTPQEQSQPHDHGASDSGPGPGR